MSDDPTPDPPQAGDAFTEGLAERLHATADRVDGADVTRVGVTAAVDRTRHRQARTRAAVVGIAATIAVLGGVAVATRTGEDPSEKLSTAGPGQSAETRCRGEDLPVPTDPLGWFRLTDRQAEVLNDAGIITAAQARSGSLHIVLLTYEEMRALEGTEPLGQQLFEVGQVDTELIDGLRSAGLLTADQEQTLAGGTSPYLTEEQAEWVFAQFPDRTAVSAGGGPMTTTVGTSEGDQVIVPPDNTPLTVPERTEGTTPFDEWVEVLRSQGLLTPEQEAEAAAGRGFSLTVEQSAALQAYWDSQAAGSTTTALAFAPSGSAPVPPSTTSPCVPADDGGATTTSSASSEATTTIAEATTTTTAVSTTVTTTAPVTAQGDGAWVVYLYVLSGLRSADGSITPTDEEMSELMASPDTVEGARARAARLAAGGRTVQMSNLECDPGAAEALGLDPELGQRAVSVGFADLADAQAFADGLPDDLGASEPVYVVQSCAQPRATE